MYESSVANAWRQEGSLKQARLDVVQVFQHRFPNIVPNDLIIAVNELTDLDELSRWLVAAATAPSLDAFRAAVQQEARS